MWVFLTLSRSGPASAPRRAVSRCARRGRTPLATQLSFKTLGLITSDFYYFYTFDDVVVDSHLTEVSQDSGAHTRHAPPAGARPPHAGGTRGRERRLHAGFWRGLLNCHLPHVLMLTLAPSPGACVWRCKPVPIRLCSAWPDVVQRTHSTSGRRPRRRRGTRRCRCGGGCLHHASAV